MAKQLLRLVCFLTLGLVTGCGAVSGNPADQNDDDCADGSCACEPGDPSCVPAPSGSVLPLDCSSCVDDAGCGEGRRCVQTNRPDRRFCAALCENNAQCTTFTTCTPPPDGGANVCYPEGNQCNGVRCGSNSACPSGQVCNNGICGPPAVSGPCREHADCGTGRVCNNGTCQAAPVNTTCTTNADCRFNYVCGPAGTCVCTLDTWTSFGQTFFQQRCQNCHGGQTPPLLSTYENVKNFAFGSRAEIVTGGMPPGGGLSQEERTRADRWLSCGSPR